MSLEVSEANAGVGHKLGSRGRGAAGGDARRAPAHPHKPHAPYVACAFEDGLDATMTCPPQIHTSSCVSSPRSNPHAYTARSREASKASSERCDAPTVLHDARLPVAHCLACDGWRRTAAAHAKQDGNHWLLGVQPRVSELAGPQPTAPRAGRRCFASGSGVRRPGAQSYPVRTSSTSAVVAHRSWLQAHTQTV